MEAKPYPSPLFSSHAVIQVGKNIPVWGTASPKEKITISFAGESCSTITGEDGYWQAALPSVSKNVSGSITFSGDEIVKSDDVISGDIWLCSGQSNMELLLANASGYLEAMNAKSNIQLRQFYVVPQISKGKKTILKGWWQTFSSQTAESFSAIGYYFGDTIYQKEKTPVGIINATLGATSLEAWISLEASQGLEAGRQFYEKWQTRSYDYKIRRDAWKEAYAVWKENVKKAREDEVTYSEKAPELTTDGGPDDRNTPSGLFNGMIFPLFPCSMKGILWYQGEGNFDRPLTYPDLQRTLITEWRNGFKNSNLPFIFVQLPNFAINNNPDGLEWAIFREKQAESLGLDHTGMAVTIDVGEANDIHPKDKKSVGDRLALLALKIAYHRDVDVQGPVYQKIIQTANTVVVEFNTHGKSLVLKPMKGIAFEVAGEDKVFYSANAKIDGTNKIVLKSENVSAPVAVRYCWRNSPTACLWDEEGLPAAPFRTDNW